MSQLGDIGELGEVSIIPLSDFPVLLVECVFINDGGLFERTERDSKVINSHSVLVESKAFLLYYQSSDESGKTYCRGYSGDKSVL